MEIIPNEGLPKLGICEPAGMEVEPGKVYSWCSCGLSEKEPFCQCKRTRKPPFCDGSHKKTSLS